jgi:nucleoside-diphosphate-sugar epimerase/glyoxylase-like metal-dependent hydrolase (beta-lactamase superfamily II)
MVHPNVIGAIRAALGAWPRKVLVTGASGFVGSHLARALADAGHVVTGTGRNRYRAGRVRGEAVCWQEADVCDAAAIRRLCTGKDLVYHTAALSTPWAPAQLLREVNVGGTRNVVEACLAHGVKRLVHVSSTAIFFQYRDRLLVRDDEPWPHRFCCPYAASKAQAERVVRGGVERGLNAVIVRARAVFGPGDNAILPRLLRAAADRRLRQVGAGRNITDLTYVDNLIYALALAADQGCAGVACTVTNEQPVELWEVVRRIVRELGLSLPPRRIPYAVARGTAGLLEFVHHALSGRGEPAMTRYVAGLLAKSQTFDPATARRHLNYHALVPVGEGVRRTIAALRARDEGPARAAVRLRLFSTGLTRHFKHYVQCGAPRVLMPFHAAFALIEHPTEGVTLFDTGYAPRFFTATRRFPYSLYRRVTPVETGPGMTAVRTLRRLGIEAREVRRVIISHFHADHICGLRDFPRAEFIAPARAWEAVRGLLGIAALRRGFLPDLLPADFAERVRTVEHFHDPGLGPFDSAHDLFGDGSVRLFDLPGHARGQVGVLLQTGRAERKFLVADAVWTTESMRERRPPHPITRTFIDSSRELRATLDRLYDFHRRFSEVEIIPTHCPEVARKYSYGESIATGFSRSES